MAGAWKILKDHMCDDKTAADYDAAFDRTGKQSSDWQQGNEAKPECIHYKTYDDDKNLCREGLLMDDPWCQGQERVLNYDMNDVGATFVKVLRGHKWVVEIG